MAIKKEDKITIIIAHYRLPYPLYYSGADKSTMELALALQQSGVKVIALFCTGGVSTSSLARRFKEAQLAYSQTDQGVEYKYKELTVQVLPPNRFKVLY